jgi:hypothetical protein
MTLNQNLEMYNKPLNEDSMQAIIKLIEVATEKQKKKNEKRKKKVKIIQAELEKARTKEETPVGVLEPLLLMHQNQYVLLCLLSLSDLGVAI